MTEKTLPYDTSMVSRAYTYIAVTANPTVMPAGPGPAHFLVRAMGASRLTAAAELLPALAGSDDYWRQWPESSKPPKASEARDA